MMVLVGLTSQWPVSLVQHQAGWCTPLVP